MKNIRITIEYDGTDYSGWQKQKKSSTLQSIIENALLQITNKPVKITGASRTDAGVHALGQVACFRTDTRLEPAIIRRALNAVLPEDIRILKAEDAASEFHPRYDALSKSYFYIIDNTDTASAFIYRYSWRLPFKLNIAEIKRAGEMLIGRHDFSAFRGAGCGAKNTLREITSMEIKVSKRIDFMTAKLEGRFIKIRIEANAFLRHMVRNIVGTLVEAGRGRLDAESIADALRHKDRKRTGPTAPAKGLFLERIRY